MKYGYGAPFVRVFTSRGEISHRVSDFEYKYSQKDGDSCQLSIEMEDPFIPDLPEYQEGTILDISWGYVGGTETKRKVKIADIKPSYTHDKMTLNLLCTNLADRLKHSSRNKVHKKASLDSIADDIAKENGLKKKPSTQQDENVIRNIRDTSYQKVDGNYTAPRDETSNPIQFRLYEALPQANKSDMKLLKELAEVENDGPHEVYGRDDEIVVRKLPLKQKPYKTYDYNSGNYEVLSFTPETKNQSNKAEASNININMFDEETQAMMQGLTSRQEAKDSKLGSTIQTQPNSNSLQSDFRQTITKYADRIRQAIYLAPFVPIPVKIAVYAKDRKRNKDNAVLRDPKEALRAATLILPGVPTMKAGFLAAEDGLYPSVKGTTQANRNAEEEPSNALVEKLKANGQYQTIQLKNQSLVLRPYNTASDAYQNDDGNITAEVNSTRTVGYYPLIEAARTEPQPDAVDAANKSANKQVEKSMEMNPGNLVVLGDPLLVSGIVVTVSGIAKKYAGNYYVNDCTHRMKVNGYYDVEMSINRNAVNASSGDNVNKVPSEETKAETVNTDPGPKEADWSLQVKDGRWIWTQKADKPINQSPTFSPATKPF